MTESDGPITIDQAERWCRCYMGDQFSSQALQNLQDLLLERDASLKVIPEVQESLQIMEQEVNKFVQGIGLKIEVMDRDTEKQWREDPRVEDEESKIFSDHFADLTKRIGLMLRDARFEIKFEKLTCEQLRAKMKGGDSRA